MSHPGVNLRALKEHYQGQLLQLLESVSGQKDLILDPDIMKLLEHISGMGILRSVGVQKVYRLESGPSPRTSNNRVFILRPHLVQVKYICDHINQALDESKASKGSLRHVVIFLPRILQTAMLLMEEKGIAGHVTVQEFEMDFLPLDVDLLSLELGDFFNTFYLHGDYTWILNAARALWKLQHIFGKIPNVYGHGRAATLVHDLSQKLFAQLGSPKIDKYEIGYLFMFDREIDYVSALLSQLTYHGLLDEMFGVKCGFVEFGKNVTGKDQPTKLLLNSEDELFLEIEDMHFAHVVNLLSNKIKQLQSQYTKQKNMSIKELQLLVANDLKNLQQQHGSLAMHIGACEVITKSKGDEFKEQLEIEGNMVRGYDHKKTIMYLEDCMARQTNRIECLRLLCLYSCCEEGLSSKDYKSLKMQYLQGFGYDYLAAFTSLKKLGLFADKDAPSVLEHLSSGQTSKILSATSLIFPYPSQLRTISKRLQLTPPEANYDCKHPTDMGYVFGGTFIPIIPRIVQEALNTGGNLGGIDDILKLLPGKTINMTTAASEASKAKTASLPLLNQNARRVAVVFFLGGATYAEIGALRHLGNLLHMKFIIATTALMNGNQMLDMVCGSL